VIAHLKGRVLRKTPQEVVIDVAGVGYRVAIPVSTFYRVGDEGDELSLRIYTQVREDTLALFGFLTAAEQEVFERLISVAGVGPKLAVGILSGIEVGDFVTALRGNDLARLTRIPGVGKKTAERLVLELKDKLKATLAGEPATAAPAPAASPKDDLLSALANLGYSRPEVERAVDRALTEDNGGRFEDLLRRALQLVSGR
jgi:Holliday junction DNA helicase RuvA